MLQEQMQMQTERRPEMEHRVHFGRLKNVHMPTFDGSLDPELVEKWVSELKNNFEVLERPEEVKTTVAKPFLAAKAKNLLKSIAPALTTNSQEVTWNIFKKEFLNNYFSQSL